MENIFSLEGKVAIVTGASGLIGKEHCRALAQAGATVVCCDTNQDKLQEIVSELGDKHLARVIDVTNASTLTALRDELWETHGGIHVLVNNAAINDMVENPELAAEFSRFENYPITLWKKVMDVNVTGVFLCCQVFGTVMAQRKYGSIINVASTYGVVAPDQSIYKLPDGTQPFYKSPVYPTSKGAVIMLTKYLATYWGHTNVRVNTLSPGGVKNNQPEHFIENYSAKTPLGRMANTTDYKGALVFLASDASEYVTGHNLIVDGGWTAW